MTEMVQKRLYFMWTTKVWTVWYSGNREHAAKIVDLATSTSGGSLELELQHIGQKC